MGAVRKLGLAEFRLVIPLLMSIPGILASPEFSLALVSFCLFLSVSMGAFSNRIVNHLVSIRSTSA